MEQHQVIVVGGGIGGSAAALRAAQHGLKVAWIRGDAGSARASRARYVFSIDNMIGVSGGIVQRKVLELLSGPEHAAAREAIARTHFHVGIPEIVEDVTLRLTADFADQATLVDEKAIAARREGSGFAVETDRGRTFRGGAVVLSTGVMDRQPSVKLTTKSGKLVDDIRWIYPGPTPSRCSTASCAKGTSCAARAWRSSARARPRRRSRCSCTSATASPSRCLETAKRSRPRRRTLFPSGIAAANLLGFTTQSARRGELATSAMSLPRKLVGGDTVIHARRPAAWAGLSDEDAALLDFLRRGGKTSELTQDDTVQRTLALLSENGRLDRLLRIAGAEPPRVRAVLGAMAEQLGKPFATLRRLRASLNPSSRFDFGVLSGLPHARSWQAKGRP